MAGYLTKLWDDYSRLVLGNSRDLDVRDEDYPEKVRAIVWQAVRSLRDGRKTFRAEIRREIQEKRRGRRVSRSPKA